MKSNFPDLIVEQMKTLTRVQNNAGCQIDPLVPSIQTVGTKTKGFIYADNNQPNTAWTIKSDYVGDSTEIVINDASVFERIDMKAILGKLQNLSTAIASNVLTVAVQADTPTDIGTSSNSYVNNITVGVSSLTIQKNGLYNVKINATTYQEAYTKIHAKVNSDVIAVKELDITSGDGAVSSRCLVIDTLAELKKGDKVTFGLTSYRAATYKNVNYSLLLVAE